MKRLLVVLVPLLTLNLGCGTRYTYADKVGSDLYLHAKAGPPLPLFSDSYLVRCRETAGPLTRCIRLQIVEPRQARVVVCVTQPACRSEGRCSHRLGKCLVATDADCQSAQVCVVHGRCSVAAGICVAATDAGCRASQRCKIAGHCFSVNGYCAAKTGADCRASARCGEHGDCSMMGERCGAVADSDCAASRGCRTRGKCRADQGVCVRPAKGTSATAK